MRTGGWHNSTVHLPSDAATIVCHPLDDNEPWDDQLIRFSWSLVDSLAVVLTADQADQLEHELERARWHRVFRQNQLMGREGIALETELENPPEPRDPEPTPSILDLPGGGYEL